MSAIQKRLLALKKKYLLTTSDLGVLLSSSRSTVRTWEEGVSPNSMKAPLIEKRLTVIEKAAKGVPSPFPVPLHVTQYQRKAYLLDVVNVASPRLSQSGASPRR